MVIIWQKKSKISSNKLGDFIKSHKKSLIILGIVVIIIIVFLPYFLRFLAGWFLMFLAGWMGFIAQQPLIFIFLILLAIIGNTNKNKTIRNICFWVFVGIVVLVSLWIILRLIQYY